MRILIIVIILLASLLAAAGDSQEYFLVDVSLERTKPNGKSWDGLGGRPDIYIVLDGYSHLAYRCQDTFSCTFISQKKSWQVVEVWDADAMNDDYAGTAKCHPGYTCSTGRGANIKIH